MIDWKDSSLNELQRDGDVKPYSLTQPGDLESGCKNVCAC